MMKELNINIILIDLSREVELNDNEDEEIRVIVKQTLKKCGTRKAGENLEYGETSTYKDIMRFVRVQDRFIAFNSVLLKSYFYHAVIRKQEMDLKEQETHFYPIVSLPRTKAGKPFIPHQSPGFGFNVSHQFPFVGMAYNLQNSDDCILGLDIVTFENMNKALYTTVTDFLDVYKSSFTKWEWDCIQNRRDDSKESNTLMNCCARDTKMSRSDNSKLWEFYLRWSMKEAYTKALGKGMGIDFSSFRIQLSEIDSSNHSSGIWNYIVNYYQDECAEKSSSEQNQPLLIKIPGTVHLIDENPEFCNFVFVPLSSCSSSHNVVTASFEIKNALLKFEFDGCACVCIKSDNTRMLRQDIHCLNMKYKAMAMKDLQHFHECGKVETKIQQ